MFSTNGKISLMYKEGLWICSQKEKKNNSVCKWVDVQIAKHMEKLFNIFICKIHEVKLNDKCIAFDADKTLIVSVMKCFVIFGYVHSLFLSKCMNSVFPTKEPASFHLK